MDGCDKIFLQSRSFVILLSQVDYKTIITKGTMIFICMSEQYHNHVQSNMQMVDLQMLRFLRPVVDFYTKARVIDVK